jgi:hypothetical protein
MALALGWLLLVQGLPDGCAVSASRRHPPAAA